MIDTSKKLEILNSYSKNRYLFNYQLMHVPLFNCRGKEGTEMKLNEFYFQWNQRLTECLIEIEASDRGRTYIHWLEQFSQQKYKNGSFYLIAFRNFICHEATIKTDGWIAANQCLSFDLDRDKYDQKTFENLLEISYQDYLKLEPDVLFIYQNLVTDF